MSDLIELKRLAEVATPGPWVRLHDDLAVTTAEAAPYVEGEPHTLRMSAKFNDCACGQVWSVPADAPVAYCDTRHMGEGPDAEARKANAAFIAALNPATVLALIARVEELEGLLEGQGSPRDLAPTDCSALDWRDLKDAPENEPVLVQFRAFNTPEGRLMEQVAWFYDGEWRTYPQTLDTAYADRWRPLSSATQTASESSRDELEARALEVGALLEEAVKGLDRAAGRFEKLSQGCAAMSKTGGLEPEGLAATGLTAGQFAVELRQTLTAIKEK